MILYSFVYSLSIIFSLCCFYVEMRSSCHSEVRCFLRTAPKNLVMQPTLFLCRPELFFNEGTQDENAYLKKHIRFSSRDPSWQRVK